MPDRFDPDGHPKRRARKGERRCGQCARIVRWPWGNSDAKWYCTGILAVRDEDACCRTDFAGDCQHFEEKDHMLNRDDFPMLPQVREVEGRERAQSRACDEIGCPVCSVDGHAAQVRERGKAARLVDPGCHLRMATTGELQQRFGAALRVIRSESGLSMNDLARTLGRSVPWVSSVELAREPVGRNELRMWMTACLDALTEARDVR